MASTKNYIKILSDWCLLVCTLALILAGIYGFANLQVRLNSEKAKGNSAPPTLRDSTPLPKELRKNLQPKPHRRAQKSRVAAVPDVCAEQIVNCADDPEIEVATKLTDSLKTDIEERYICSWYEKMAEFPGGVQVLIQYLAENLHYPTRLDGPEGRVFVRFIVTEEGDIKNPEVIRSLDSLLDREAIRLVQSMPRWIPAERNGRKVPMSYVVPISFRLR